MSIINDALKKTQQHRKMEKERKSQAIAAQPGMTKPEDYQQNNADSNQKASRLTLWIVASMLTIAGLLVIIDLSNFQGFQNAKRFAMAAVNKTKSQFKLVLDGVIVSDNTRIAMINKQPMQVGDVVNGMKIVAINLETIQLLDEKGVVELKTGATYML